MTWRLQLKSWFHRAHDVTVDWKVDGSLLARQTRVVAAEAVTTFDLPLAWTFDPHVLSVVVDPEDAIAEEVVVHTDAPPFSNATAIVRVAAAGRVGYAFLTAGELNILAVTGRRDVAELRLAVTMR